MRPAIAVGAADAARRATACDGELVRGSRSRMYISGSGGERVL